MAASSITNSTIPLDKAISIKSGLKSSGQVGGSPIVVPAHCIEEIEINRADSKVNSKGVSRKQFQSKQICRIAEEPLCKEAEGPVSNDTKESVCKETETPLCTESEEPVCKGTEELLSKDIEEIVCRETGERIYKKTEGQVCKKNKEIGCMETEEPVCEETEESVIKEIEEPTSKVHVTEEIQCKEIEEPVCKENEETVCKETEEPVCKETEEPVCKETEERIVKETEEPVYKEIEQLVSKKTEEPVLKETEEPVCKEPEEPVCKETEEQVCKETEEPVCKETEEPVLKEKEEPVCKETEEPIWKETEEPVWKETEEPVWKETEEPVWNEMEKPVNNETEEPLSESTKFTDKVESVKYTDVGHIPRSSNIELSESTKITGGENVSSNTPIKESESAEQIASSKDFSNLDIEEESNQIMNSSDELENTEADSNCIATSSVYDNPKFEDESYCFHNQELESKENTYNYTADVGTDSHGAVDGAVSTRVSLKEQHYLEKDESVIVIVDKSETDETNTKNEIARADHDIIVAKSAEKIRLLAADIVANTKVAYKVFSGCSCSQKLKVGFVLVFTCLQSVALNSHQRIGTVVKQAYSLLNLSFSGFGEQSVFAAAYQSLVGLSEPNLPGIDSFHNLNNTLGVVMRPVPTDVSNSREHEELGDTPPDSVVFSALHNHTEVDRYPETHPLQGSPEQNRTGYREANESVHGQTRAQTEDIPELQAPRRDQLSLTLDQTELKARCVDENLTNIGLTIVSQDGRRTTVTRRETTHSQEGIKPYSDDFEIQSYLFNLTRFNSLCDIPPGLSDRNNRANTFRYLPWPHSYLTPQQMADAGLFYTGIRDVTRCFYCGNCLEDWKQGEDPFIEHRNLYPECNYVIVHSENRAPTESQHGAIEATGISHEHGTEDPVYHQDTERERHCRRDTESQRLQIFQQEKWSIDDQATTVTV